MLYCELHRIVEQYPDSTAAIADEQTLSYRELWNSSKQLAASLADLGVKEGDRICLLGANSINAVIAFWGVLQCNAICVYLNDQTPAEGIRHLVEDAMPALILATQKLSVSKFSQGAEHRLPVPVVDLDSLVLESTAAHPASSRVAASASDDDIWSANRSTDSSLIAAIVYTSGSTGKPKGVCLTHDNLVSVARMAGEGYAICASDLYLMVVPLHYIHGLMILMTMHLRGACIEFMNSFMFPKLVTQKLQSSGATGFSGVPFHFTALIERGGFLQAQLPDLRWVGVTGGRCAPQRLIQIRKAHPSLQIHISYGQTECSPRITALHPDKIDSKAESVGSVADGLSVEFLDGAGKPVRPNEVGELVVAGPNVMHGYWNDPENTKKVIDNKGRLHTGDLAYIDSEGDVFILGRMQAMIKSAGERIFPEELEKIISASGLVNDVAVVGMPDMLYGQRVEAHVVLKTDTAESLQVLKAYCQDQVAFSRSPKQYHRWQAFPLKANGKTDRQKLISQIGAVAETQ